ncbi:MAG TPA: chloride channel protein [Bordetella sp.]
MRHTGRLSRKSLRLILLLIGAALVALVSLGFARMADAALEWNRRWTSAHGWLAFIVLPLGLLALRWLTLRFAPYAGGSGIPQVIGALSLPPGRPQWRLVSMQTAWKVPLTFLGMLMGASVGREGPSVQVGAAVMLAWSRLCVRLGVPLRGLDLRELIAAGAAGGLAAAFNAPLAGVVFAIEELGRGIALRWQRRVLIAVLTAGFLVVAVAGNNPYFGHFGGAAFAHGMLAWTLLCCLVNGVLGGVFARLLEKGLAGSLPEALGAAVRRHPYWLAAGMGLLMACLGMLTAGAVYGTGYAAAAGMLAGEPAPVAGFGLAKLIATVASYWAGIPGGIFTPALTTGAGIGHQIWHWAGAGVDQRVLVLLSMAAFLAAATQAPLTASVVVMEMTGSQPMLFWLLAASLGASVVSRQFSPQPFYHLMAGRFRRQTLAAEAFASKPA